MELSSHRSKYVQEVLNMPCVNQGVEDLLNGSVEGKFDLIYSNHVVEHVGDPNLYFQALRRALRPGGFGYIAVPNMFSGEHLLQSFHYAGHPSVFTLKALCRLITNHGFTLVKSSIDRNIQVLFRFDDGEIKTNTSDAAEDKLFLESLLGELSRIFLLGSQGNGKSSTYRLMGWHINGVQKKTNYEAIRLPGNWIRVLFAKICLTSPTEDGPISLGERIFHNMLTKHIGTSFMLLRLPGTEEAQYFDNALAGADPGVLPLEFVYQSPHAPFWVK